MPTGRVGLLGRSKAEQGFTHTVPRATLPAHSVSSFLQAQKLIPSACVLQTHFPARSGHSFDFSFEQGWVWLFFSFQCLGIVLFMWVKGSLLWCL